MLALVVFVPLGLNFVDEAVNFYAESSSATLVHNIGWALFGGAIGAVLFYKL